MSEKDQIFVRLKPTDLILSYGKWLEKSKRLALTEKEKQWLKAWNIYDMKMKMNDDDERRLARFIHYIGWFYPKTETENLLNNLMKLIN